MSPPDSDGILAAGKGDSLSVSDGILGDGLAWQQTLLAETALLSYQLSSLCIPSLHHCSHTQHGQKAVAACLPCVVWTLDLLPLLVSRSWFDHFPIRGCFLQPSDGLNALETVTASPNQTNGYHQGYRGHGGTLPTSPAALFHPLIP